MMGFKLFYVLYFYLVGKFVLRNVEVSYLYAVGAYPFVYEIQD